MSDTKIIGSTTTVRMELEGYEPTTGTITRNEDFSVGACIGGVFLLVPFLWIMDYKPTHTYELHQASVAPAPPAAPVSPLAAPQAGGAPSTR